MNKLINISKKLDTFFKVVQKLILISFAVAVVVIAVLTIVNAINPNAVIGSEAIRSITANYTLDLNFLVVFFVLLLVAHIFNYGAELQQLSDETL